MGHMRRTGKHLANTTSHSCPKFSLSRAHVRSISKNIFQKEVACSGSLQALSFVHLCYQVNEGANSQNNRRDTGWSKALHFHPRGSPQTAGSTAFACTQRLLLHVPPSRQPQQEHRCPPAPRSRELLMRKAAMQPLRLARTQASLTICCHQEKDGVRSSRG